MKGRADYRRLLLVGGLLVAGLLAPPAGAVRRGEPTLPTAVRELRMATATRAVTQRLERSSRLGLAAFREFMSLTMIVRRLKRRRSPSKVFVAVVAALEAKHQIEVGRRARRPTNRALRGRIANLLAAHQRIITTHAANIYALATLLRIGNEARPNQAFKRAVVSLDKRYKSAKALLFEIRSFRRKLAR